MISTYINVNHNGWQYILDSTEKNISFKVRKITLKIIYNDLVQYIGIFSHLHIHTHIFKYKKFSNFHIMLLL